MALSVERITVDCSDPDRLARWWAEALGAAPMPIVAGEFVGGGFRWVVLADPDGNAFCVAAPRD